MFIFQFDFLTILFSISSIGLLILTGYFIYDKKLSKSREKTNLQTIQDKNRALAATAALNTFILQTLDFDTLAQKIANAIPQFLGYQTGVLAIVDEQKKVLRRVAISETTGGAAAQAALEVPFNQIEISLADNENYCIKAINENKLLHTTQLYDVLRPVISKENSERVQEKMGTKTTLIYPIYSLDNTKPLGTFIVSMDKSVNQISEYEYETIGDFVKGVKIAIVNASLFTTLKKTTLALEDANKRLQNLDRLKDDFVSIASHELRTPMTAIRSYVWMALNRSDIPLSTKLKKYLDRTLISTERLINLVNEMLNISRIESGRIDISPMPFDICELLNDVYGEIEIKLKEKNLHFAVGKCSTSNVFADPNKVHQVLLNLIGNAMKFTRENGTIQINFLSDGAMLEIGIKDSGVGISKDDLSSLFKKFGRLDNSYVAAATTGGSGLGLYISKSLIELMHGKIWASSEGAGAGTTFTCSLPLANQDMLSHPERYKISPIGEAKGLEPVAI